MNIQRLYNQAVNRWAIHRLSVKCKRNGKRLFRMCPTLAELGTGYKKARDGHKASKRKQASQRDTMNQLLRS